MSGLRGGMRVRLCLIGSAALLWALAAPRLSADDPESKPKPAPASPQADSAADLAAKMAKERSEFELLKLLADSLDQIERNYVEKIDRRELIEAAIRGMTSKLDRHSTYIGPQEIEKFRSGVENEFGGVGITVEKQGERIVIFSPILGGPAHRAGVRGGDVIAQIDGASAHGLTIDEVIKRIKGPLGGLVKLTLERAVGEPVTIELKRELVRVESVLGLRRTPGDEWDFWLDEGEKIGYIRLTNFGRHTAEDLRAALRILQAGKARGLVLDLRYNPGGLLQAAIEICDLFLAEGKIVSTSGRANPTRVWNAQIDGGPAEQLPLVILINGQSASASEIVAGCLQDHERAIVVGQRSWGKGSVQNIVDLEEGKSALKLTTAGYLRPSGRNIHRNEGASESDAWGVQPNAGAELSFTLDESSDYLQERRQRDAIRGLGRREGPEPPRPPVELDRQLQLAVDQLRGKITPELAADK
jgi:carboxyl-terminal processing protease